MSRSRKKTPVHGMTKSVSEKEDKKIWHQRWRAKVKQQLHHVVAKHGQEYVDIDMRLVSNPWDMAKDGKMYWDKDDRARFYRRKGLSDEEIKKAERLFFRK